MFKPIGTILSARSVAIVGASERARWPGIIYSNLRECGYGGKVYPVNPRYREIWGVRCHPRLDAIGEPTPSSSCRRPTSSKSSPTASLPIERMWRQQRSFRITEGPSEVMKMVIARHVLNTYG